MIQGNCRIFMASLGIGAALSDLASCGGGSNKSSSGGSALMFSTNSSSYGVAYVKVTYALPTGYKTPSGGLTLSGGLFDNKAATSTGTIFTASQQGSQSGKLATGGNR
jgi:Tfp pilus tip-associated adhesin PilY1